MHKNVARFALPVALALFACAPGFSSVTADDTKADKVEKANKADAKADKADAKAANKDNNLYPRWRLVSATCPGGERKKVGLRKARKRPQYSKR